MVQIQRGASSWRSSDDLTDMDFTQAAELLGSNLDLSEDMSLIGMDNLFDDVDDVIRDDRDIFMGCTEDSQLKNDIFMSCDSTDQEMLSYDNLSPETVPYNDVTSPLHSSSDESQDTPSYSGGLTPESDIMDSDIMEPEEEEICDESNIPLVALEITGAISPLKDTRKPARRKAPTTTKAGGVRKRRNPVKSKPAKAVRGRPAKSKQNEPDIQCVKVCPPVSEKSSTNFSPSTLFPTIMSALRTNPPANAVPLERLVKPKSVESVCSPDLSCIQTPPTTPVDLKPSISMGSPPRDSRAEEAQNSQLEEAVRSITNDQALTDIVEEIDTPMISELNAIINNPQESEVNDIADVVSESSDMNTVEGSQSEQNDTLSEDSQNAVPEESQNNNTDTEKKSECYITSRGKLVRIPSPTRMTTRGITRRRPSTAAGKVKNEIRSPKAVQNLPSKVSQTVQRQVTPPVAAPVAAPEAVPRPMVSVPAQCVTTNADQPFKAPVPCQLQPVTLPVTLPVQNRTLSVPQIGTVCSKTLPLANAKSASVTVVSSTARLGQPTVTARPVTQANHPLPRPTKITAIPARSTILGVLPSTTRIRPVSATQSVPIKLQSVTPIQLQTTQAASLPGACIAKPRPQPLACAPAQLVAVPSPSTTTVPVSVRAPVVAPLPVSLPPQVLTELPKSTAVVQQPQPSVVQQPVKMEPLSLPSPKPPQMPIPSTMFIKQEIEDSNDSFNDASNELKDFDENVARRNTEILNLLNKTTNSCVKMEEDPLPRSYSGYSSSSSCSGSPAPPQSPPYHSSQTPAVVSIKEEEMMLSDFSDEEEYDRFKKLSPEEQARVKRRRYNNRVAAQRCRQRKRDYFQGLKKEIQEWECSNTQLKYEIHTLSKELKNLSKIWNEHTTKCESAAAMQKKKRRHKRSRRHQEASSGCSQNSTSNSIQPSSATPSIAPVPIVVN